MKAVFARSLDYVMAVDNRLPWNLPTDLTRFRALTLDKTVVMGRNTYMELHDLGARLDRRKIVIASRNPYQLIYRHNDIFRGKEVLGTRDILRRFPDAVIVGGPEILKAFHKHITSINETVVQTVIGQPEGKMLSRLPASWRLRFRTSDSGLIKSDRDDYAMSFRYYESPNGEPVVIMSEADQEN